MACVALTRRGNPCHYKTLPDAAFCANHDPENVAALAQQNAANARQPRTRPSQRLLDASLALTDRASIQAALDTAIRLQLAGRISDARARTLLRYLRTASLNFEPTILGTPRNHEWRGYFQRVEGLLATIDPLLEELAQHDACREDLEARQ